MEIQPLVDALAALERLIPQALCDGWETKTAQDFWLPREGESNDLLAARLTELSSSIVGSYRCLKTDPKVREDMGLVISLGNQISSPHFQSEDLQEIMTDQLRLRLTRFGSLNTAGGRRLRMEILSSCWLITYFYGIRQDQFLEAVMRLMTVAQAIPTGLSYLVIISAILDDERYRHQMNISRGRVYICRKRPTLLFGQSQEDYLASAEADYRQQLSSRNEGKLPALFFLAYLCSQMQIALCLSASRGGQPYVVLFADSADFIAPESNQSKLKECWSKMGLEIVLLEGTQIEDIGMGLFGTQSGAGYYGSENDTHVGIDRGPRYRGFPLERENLHSKRREAERYYLEVKRAAAIDSDRQPSAEPAREEVTADIVE